MNIINNSLQIKLSKETYKIPINQLAKVSTYVYRCTVTDQVHFENVSEWIKHLCLTRNVGKIILNELEEVIKKQIPENNIDWKTTHTMVDFIEDFTKEYNRKYKLKNLESIFENINTREAVRSEVFELIRNKVIFKNLHYKN